MTKQVAVFGDLDGETRARARTLGFDLDPVPLQDLFVHLTAGDPGAGHLTDGPRRRETSR